MTRSVEQRRSAAMRARSLSERPTASAPSWRLPVPRLLAAVLLLLSAPALAAPAGTLDRIKAAETIRVVYAFALPRNDAD